MCLARNKLLSDGYTEVMTYVFRNTGVIEVLESASDKKLLRTNLVNGLKESMKLNLGNAALLGLNEVKIFEIGTIFKKDAEEIHVAYGNKKEIKEMSLDEFCKNISQENLTDFTKQGETKTKFKMWSLFPFITRDIAVWVPEKIESLAVVKIIKENMEDLVVRGPELFDTFTKEGKTSYAYRLIFQSYERTLSDLEVNKIMEKITQKMNANSGWQVR
jgi:phenylalanyl-tRNA synthetase beta subunit